MQRFVYKWEYVYNMGMNILIVGNWKLNPAKADDAKKLSKKVRNFAKTLSKVDIVICPPFPFIPLCKSKNDPSTFHIGAQSTGAEFSGSYTGLVSASMLKDLGVEYVIVGHSEERMRGESEDLIAKKAKIVVEQGMTPIVCVGEKIRDESGSHYDFVRDQVKSAFSLVSKNNSKDVIIAYEPVWAIGASEAMQTDAIYEMSLFLKKVFADMFGTDSGLKARILYGGAVNVRNAEEIMRVGKVDGLLIGRESLNAPAFLELIRTIEAK